MAWSPSEMWPVCPVVRLNHLETRNRCLTTSKTHPETTFQRFDTKWSHCFGIKYFSFGTVSKEFQTIPMHHQCKGINWAPITYKAAQVVEVKTTWQNHSFFQMICFHLSQFIAKAFIKVLSYLLGWQQKLKLRVHSAVLVGNISDRKRTLVGTSEYQFHDSLKRWDEVDRIDNFCLILMHA